MVDVLSALSNPSSGIQNESAVGLAEDFSSFLNLLTVQLQNQDPTEPLDSNQLTDQIVQFTQAEQLVNMNTKLDKVAEGLAAQTAASAGTYVGREIEYSLPEFTFNGNSAVDIDYVLPVNANKLTIKITTETGQVMKTLSGDKDAGRQTFTWDGTDTENKPAGAGVYRVSVEALDGQDNPLNVGVINTGVISRANYVNGQLEFGVGDVDLVREDIVSINGDAVLTALDQNLAALGLLNDNTSNGLGALNGAVNQNSILASTLGLIDKNVEYSRDSVAFGSDDPSVSYRLTEDYDEVKFKVTNSDGNVVFDNEVVSESGSHQFNLSDIQIQGGSGGLSEGNYTIEITAKNEARKEVGSDGKETNIPGSTLNIMPFTAGKVSEIDMIGNTPTLFVGNTRLGINQITRIVQ